MNDKINNSDDTVDSVLDNDFPYKEVFECATVWLREKPYKSNRSIGKIIDNKTLKKRGYKKFEITKGTRIGFGEQNWDNGEMTIDGIIVFTEDGYYYNYQQEFICDGSITFEIADGIGYNPSSEPVDLINNNYRNGGGGKIKNVSEIKCSVAYYELNILLVGA